MGGTGCPVGTEGQGESSDVPAASDRGMGGHTHSRC